MRFVESQLKPLIRIGLAFLLVWFYHGMTSGIFSGVLRLGVVVALAFGTWILIMRIFFPASTDSSE